MNIYNMFFMDNWKKISQTYYRIVCVEVLRPSQPMGSCRARSVFLNHTFTGQAYCSKRLTSIVHILSQETDNCPS